MKHKLITATPLIFALSILATPTQAGQYTGQAIVTASFTSEDIVQSDAWEANQIDYSQLSATWWTYSGGAQVEESIPLLGEFSDSESSQHTSAAIDYKALSFTADAAVEIGSPQWTGSYSRVTFASLAPIEVNPGTQYTVTLDFYLTGNATPDGYGLGQTRIVGNLIGAQGAMIDEVDTYLVTGGAGWPYLGNVTYSFKNVSNEVAHLSFFAQGFAYAQAVPEPSAYILVLAGLACMLSSFKTRRR